MAQTVLLDGQFQAVPTDLTEWTHIMFLWIPIVVLIYLVATRAGTGGSAVGYCAGHAGHAPASVPTGPEPIDIARQRLARGEITIAKFEEIRRAIA